MCLCVCGYVCRSDRLVLDNLLMCSSWEDYFCSAQPFSVALSPLSRVEASWIFLIRISISTGVQILCRESCWWGFMDVTCDIIIQNIIYICVCVYTYINIFSIYIICIYKTLRKNLNYTKIKTKPSQIERPERLFFFFLILSNWDILNLDFLFMATLNFISDELMREASLVNA